MKITPVFIVESVEACLEFWVDRIGLAKVAEVPEGDRIGFAILVNEGTELMLQAVESVRKDAPQLASNEKRSGVTLFIEVAEFSDILARLRGYPIAAGTYYLLWHA